MNSYRKSTHYQYMVEVCELSYQSPLVHPKSVELTFQLHTHKYANIIQDVKWHYKGQLLWLANESSSYFFTNPFGKHCILHIFISPNFCFTRLQASTWSKVWFTHYNIVASGVILMTSNWYNYRITLPHLHATHDLIIKHGDDSVEWGLWKCC